MTVTNTLKTLLITSCVLSICGTVLVFVRHIRYPELWKRPARRLLVYLCITDFLTAIVYLLPTSNNETLCEIQSVLGIYFPVASFLWTDCIALYVYLIISSLTRRSYLLRSYRRLFGIFHLVSWILPFLCAFSVFITNHAGRSDETETKGWCWVKAAEDDDDHNNNKREQEVFFWEIIGGKFIEWFSILIWCPILYYNCWWHLSRHERNAKIYRTTSSSTTTTRQQYHNTRQVSVNSTFSVDTNDDDNQPINFTDFKRKLFYVPIIFFILRLPGSIRTIFLFISPNLITNTIYGNSLSYLQTFCDPLQGFCNGILFVVCNSNSSHPSTASHGSNHPHSGASGDGVNGHQYYRYGDDGGHGGSDDGFKGRKFRQNEPKDASLEYNTSPMLEEEFHMDDDDYYGQNGKDNDSLNDTVEDSTSCEGESWNDHRASGTYRTRLDPHSIIE